MNCKQTGKMLENNSHFLWQGAHDNPYLDGMKMAETITVHALFSKAVLQDIGVARTSPINVTSASDFTSRSSN